MTSPSHRRSRVALALLAVASLAAAPIALGGAAMTASATIAPQTPVFVDVPTVASTVETTVGNPCSGIATCDAPTTMSYGNGVAKRIESFTGPAGQLFEIAKAADGSSALQRVDLLRVDNANITGERGLIWMSRATGSTDYRAITGTDPGDRTMESVLGDTIVTDGADNLFANGVAGSTVTNLNNIERASFLSPTPITPAEPAQTGVLLLERGGNDPVRIAAVLSVDAAGKPLTFGTPITVPATGWTTVLAGLPSTVLRKTAADTAWRPSQPINPQNIGGVFVSYEELGVAVGTPVAGVAVVAGDQVSFDSDFVTTTSEASGAGGLDLMGGIIVDSVPPGSISGRLFTDDNGDGLDSSSDRPLAGVTVELRDALGNLLQTTVTAADGSYSFTDLLPIAYTVGPDVSTLPPGFPRVGTIEADASLDGSTPASVTSAQPDLTGKSFGYPVLEPISGSVVTAGGAPIAGVTIELLNASGDVIQTVQTDAAGAYAFEPAPVGSYTVRETQPAGYLTDGERPGPGSTDAGENLIAVTTSFGAPSTANVFVEQSPTADISGVVRTEGGTPIGAATVELLAPDGTVLATVQTASDGTYSFADLPGGEYTVRETQPAGYTDSREIPGNGASDAGTNAIAVTLAPGISSVGNTFVEETPTGLISGTVVDDAAAPIADVMIELLDAAGAVIDTTMTDSSGAWSFTGLLAGDYSVRELQPTGYTSATNIAGTNAAIAGPDVISASIPIGPSPANSSVGNTFVERAGTGTISGAVRTVGGIPIADVTVDLLDADGAVIATTVTAADGTYSFTSVPAGAFTLREAQPAGYDTAGEEPGNGAIDAGENLIAVSLAAGGTSAGNVFLESTPTGRVSGSVVTEAGTPIAGVRIEAVDAAGNVIGTTTTAADGSWAIADLPRESITVREVQPDRYDSVSVEPGDDATTVTVDSVTVDLSIDGVSSDTRFVEHASQGSIAGASRTESGAGIAGVVVELLTPAGAVLRTTTTDAAGAFAFTELPAGEYRVRQIQPGGYVSSGQTPGTGAASGGENIFSVTLARDAASVGSVFVERTVPVTPGRPGGGVGGAGGTAGGGLAVTGGEIAPLGGVALALLMLGAAATLIARSRSVRRR